MKYIKKFENFSTKYESHNLFENWIEDSTIDTIKLNPQLINEVINIVDKELSKLSDIERENIKENLENILKSENIKINEPTDIKETIEKVSQLSDKHKQIYYQLLNKWKEEQEKLGKNTNPGQGTRKRLIRQSMMENIFTNFSNSFRKTLNFADDCLTFLKFRIGLISAATSIIYSIVELINSQNLSWWQIIWFGISVIYWRLQTLALKDTRKEREQIGIDKKWYY
jgi:hypothetical protein